MGRIHDSMQVGVVASSLNCLHGESAFTIKPGLCNVMTRQPNLRQIHVIHAHSRLVLANETGLALW